MQEKKSLKEVKSATEVQILRAESCSTARKMDRCLLLISIQFLNLPHDQSF